MREELAPLRRVRQAGDSSSALSEQKLQCVAHFGTFDIDNYGDLLFPLICEQELSSIANRVLHVSPTANKSTFPGALPSISIRELPKHLADIDGVVLGGGHLLCASHTSLAPYQNLPIDSSQIYPQLWSVPSIVAGLRSVPLCWNAPGSRPRLTSVDRYMLRLACESADYAAVRDRKSERLLVDAGCNTRISVVPDSALGISNVFPRDRLTSAYWEVFQKARTSLPQRSIVFHFKERYTHAPATDLAMLADAICRRYAARAVLLALGKCHGDQKLQQLIGRHMDTSPVVLDPSAGLLAHVAVIALSHMYLGSSLHGLITAIAYGAGALVVADEQQSGFHKFSGFLEHVEGSHLLLPTWAAAARYVLDDCRSFALRAAPVDNARQALARHWQRIRQELRRTDGKTHIGSPATQQLKDRVLSRRYSSGFLAHEAQ